MFVQHSLHLTGLNAINMLCGDIYCEIIATLTKGEIHYREAIIVG